MNKLLRVSITLLLLISICTEPIAQKIKTSYLSSNPKESFTGNVYLYLSKSNKNPKDGSIGVESFPCYRIAVKNIKPKQAVVFDDAAVSYPVKLSDIERGDYYVQAVWDKNLGGRAIGKSPGNLYNTSNKVTFTKNTGQVYAIACKEVEPEPAFVETEYIKELKASSKLLSNFYRRPTTIDAAVLLPKQYKEQPQRRFPVVYEVSGYGGDYHGLSGEKDPSEPIDTTPCIKVFLDGNAPLGHTVYANSENNGPWGDALTQELIPEVEKRFRCNAARLLTGHSSGGWTVLWLQTHYPKLFIACWSSSPDPVDFRNFQLINLYTDKNMFYGSDSSLRMMATVAGAIPWASQKQAYGMEHVILRGEQMHSFDAVFSQRSKNGLPRMICNPLTGEIDSVTVSHWKAYDISLHLRNNWNQLNTDLQGKIRVSVGEGDNFLLNHAVHLLDEEMQKLNSGFLFGYYPGDHFTVYSPEYKKAGHQFLQQKYREFMLQSSSANSKQY
jgi:S-formylglutathione hydrolase FrmB